MSALCPILSADGTNVTDFDQEVRGIDGYTMPATQHDLWLWVAGHAYDKVFDVTKEAVQVLASLVSYCLLGVNKTA